jgi:thioredoxin reductase (NADPH)
VAPLLLAVDRDPGIARNLTRALQRRFDDRGYRAISRYESVAALDLIRDQSDGDDPVALIVANNDLAEMSGVELITEARQIDPQIRTALRIEHAKLQDAFEASERGVLDEFRIKPCDWKRDLLPMIDDLLDGWESERWRREQAVRIVGPRDSRHTHRIRSFLERNMVHRELVDLDCGEGRELLARAGRGQDPPLPVVVLKDGTALARPSNFELAEKLEIPTQPSEEHYDLAIVGGGPAGLAAAVYGSSEGLETLLVDREAPGGQAAQSHKIENYLGFHRGVSGSNLAWQALLQAKRFGVDLVRPRDAVSLQANGDDRLVELSGGSKVAARSVVIATGVEYRRLEAPGVSELLGAGVSYGAAPSDAQRCVDKRVFVVGGANSAGQAALDLSQHARKVTMLVRGDASKLGMSRYLIDRIQACEAIEVLTRAELIEAHGQDRLEELTLSLSGKISDQRVPADALFIFIGAMPHTEWLQGVLARDDNGFILAGRDLAGTDAHGCEWPLEREPYPLETSMPGVFVAGDARRGSIKRVASAVGEGSMAVQLLHQYLAEREREEPSGQSRVESR